MSLDVYIHFKKPRSSNYFLEHPYIYDFLSDADRAAFYETDCWSANITHNLGEMAAHVPVFFNNVTNLYQACWRPEEMPITNTDDMLRCLTQGLMYMIANRKELLKYEAPNGWGTYNGFMKFILNYKQACEDNPDCLISASR